MIRDMCQIQIKLFVIETYREYLPGSFQSARTGNENTRCTRGVRCKPLCWYIYIYMYIYMCVCVCVCDIGSQKKEKFLHESVVDAIKAEQV